MKHRLSITILLTLLSLTIAPIASAQHMVQNDSAVAQSSAFQLRIPTLGINLSVINAPISGNSWDFTHINQEAGHLEGLPFPGEKNNVVIGAHSELESRRPGPFYHLKDIKVGDEILLVYGDKTYTYRVEATWEVVPSQIEPILGTRYEALTLMTCSGYKAGDYTTRLIVRASLSTRLPK